LAIEITTVRPAKFESGDAKVEDPIEFELSGEVIGLAEGDTGDEADETLWDSITLGLPDRLNFCFNKESGPARLFSFRP
jgi:hypothetical protein